MAQDGQSAACQGTDVALLNCVETNCKDCSRENEQDESLTATGFECENIKKDLAQAVCPTLQCCPACQEEVVASLKCGSEALEVIMKQLGNDMCDLSTLECPEGMTQISPVQSSAPTTVTAKSVSVMTIAAAGALLLN